MKCLKKKKEESFQIFSTKQIFSTNGIHKTIYWIHQIHHYFIVLDMYGATQYLFCRFRISENLPFLFHIEYTKKNSPLTGIYVVYVNPRCENKHNSSRKGYKKRMGSNPYKKKKNHKGPRNQNHE